MLESMYRLSSGRRGQGASRSARLACLLVAAVGVAAIVISGCTQSSPEYPLDWFGEMHYAPMWRPQEPPRLYPSSQSVETTGIEVPVTTEQAHNLKNPVPGGAATLQQAKVLFDINCVYCHGKQGYGDGVIAPYFKNVNSTPPADFRQSDDKTAGDLYYLMTYGVRDPQTLVGMPAFRYLLTETQRWTLAHMIMTIAGTEGKVEKPASGETEKP